MNSPSATYRIQFHKDFTFKHLDQLIPYFKMLGVKTIYAAPIFEAIPGSTHGYDVVNPHRINPEIGTEEELIALSSKLKANQITWLQDIVPNHMAFHPSNLWLMDVLENWSESPYFNFFDINFPTKLNDNRLMVPFLGETLADAVENRALKLEYQEGKLYLAYQGSSWPVNLDTYQLVLPNAKLKKITDFQEIAGDQPHLSAFTAKLEEINGDSGKLMQIAYAQHYRLCHWQETENQINYRRFFTVNGLICLNIQHQEVFDVYHQYIFSLVERGIFDGLRIDHVDGLFDPKTYLERLRSSVGAEVYIVVEKILSLTENMPVDWPIQGNTGYDFLAIANNLFTNKDAEKPFNKLYKEVINKPFKVDEQIIAKKTAILYGHMQGELDNLHQLFLDFKLADKKQLNELKEGTLKQAIADFLINCPIYRYYGNSLPLEESEQADLAKIFLKLPKTADSLPAINLLTTVFFDHAKQTDHAYQQNASYFYLRCMQFSGPLMAKGVEDTLMYTYNRFIAHTEVGDAPDSFGLTTAEFHDKMVQRKQLLPLSMNATATHDTKRGEDVRAKLNVLTDLPEQWRKLVLKLQSISPKNFDSELNLHQNDVYLIYQTLYGAMPFTNQEEDTITERLALYLEKALREAKKRSDWAAPNNEYEETAKKFTIALINRDEESFQLLNNFLQGVADYSIVNSLAQVLLKFTCPGIPDVYQGTELWDLSLVDPDNRRPVDYEMRYEWLKEINQKVELKELWATRLNGKIKLWLTHQLFKVRSLHQELFDKGSYIPLKVKGKYHKNVLAYLRKYQDQYILVAIPLGIAKIAEKQNCKVNEINWEGTELSWPAELPLQWKDLLTGADGQQDIAQQGILIADLFTTLPLSLLHFKVKEKTRGAGLLLSISSLPSAFGIGDFGKEAFKFIDFLAETRQKYWQLLPLNPTSATQNYSPYSAYSAMAGNVMLISPTSLLEDQLLEAKGTKRFKLPTNGAIDYTKVETVKAQLLHLAYKNFKSLSDHKLLDAYQSFCESEKSWLDDFALFSALRKYHQNMPWLEWPEVYKFREPKALTDFSESNAAMIDEIKWQQFVFYRQWHQLKAYANEKNIELIGDLPFYVSHDSADVWANREFFKLDAELNMDGIAGVPPDAFNAEGQVWGMPVFNWERLKEANYEWWMIRIRKNLELFDILRLDHFRAFDSYWEIPIGEESAINGKWIDGPGASFFKAVYQEFKEFPFVAEDLGGDMENPIRLRNEFGLAGMKVLQFAFGSDLPFSPHIPHNYENNNFIVYTGTHDNNTTKGWYRTEIEESGKVRLDLYTGKSVAEANVHEVMIQLALASSAKTAIVPVQDLIGADETTRMNTPATVTNNWVWQLKEKELTEDIKNWLLTQTILYGRS
jgi:malto-oligosyltrehalose synthase/4-alpha-glucanotransferase